MKLSIRQSVPVDYQREIVPDSIKQANYINAIKALDARMRLMRTEVPFDCTINGMLLAKRDNTASYRLGIYGPDTTGNLRAYPNGLPLMAKTELTPTDAVAETRLFPFEDGDLKISAGVFWLALTANTSGEVYMRHLTDPLYEAVPHSVITSSTTGTDIPATCPSCSKYNYAWMTMLRVTSIG